MWHHSSSSGDGVALGSSWVHSAPDASLGDAHWPSSPTWGRNVLEDP